MQQRIEYLDSLKTIGILAVILGHINTPLTTFIFSWHMPLFFIIAGFFLKFDISLKEFLIKDTKRLMLPYFIFSLLGLCLEFVKRLLLDREQLDLTRELQGIFMWMDMSTLINTYAFVLWFLPALFFVRLLLFLIHHWIKNRPIQILLVSLLFILSFYLELPWAIDNALNALLFVYIGHLFFRSYQVKTLLTLEYPNFTGISLTGIALAILSLMAIYSYIGIPSLDMASKNYQQPWFNIIWAVAIVYLLIVTLKKLDNKKNIFNKVKFHRNLLMIWGGNTMLLFIMHPYTNNIGYLIVEKIHFGDWPLKLFISLFLLQIILLLKIKLEQKGFFKYV